MELTIVYADGEDVSVDYACRTQAAAASGLLRAWDSAEFEAPNWPATLTDRDGTAWSLVKATADHESMIDEITYRCG